MYGVLPVAIQALPRIPFVLKAQEVHVREKDRGMVFYIMLLRLWGINNVVLYALCIPI